LELQVRNKQIYHTPFLVIWTAQGKYLTLNSTEETAGKHSGIFWAFSQAWLDFLNSSNQSLF
jgi:hypothetical protein